MSLCPHISRGVRQGSVLSPLLFLLIMDPLPEGVQRALVQGDDVTRVHSIWSFRWRFPSRLRSLWSGGATPTSASSARVWCHALLQFVPLLQDFCSPIRLQNWSYVTLHAPPPPPPPPPPPELNRQNQGGVSLGLGSFQDPTH